MKKSFGKIEIGELFRFNCIFWVKNSTETAKAVSDDYFEKGTYKFFPDPGTSLFKTSVMVEPKERINKLPKNKSIYEVISNYSRPEIDLLPA